jgi:uncharacterized lipoprotein
MKTRKRHLQLVLLATMSTLLLLAACSSPGQPGAARKTSDSGGQSGQASPAATGDTQSQPASGSGTPADQGGQNKPTSYTDTRYNYRVTGPGPISPRSDGTASFTGEDERFEVAVIQGDRAADPLGLAQGEINSLSSSSTNFRTVFAPAKVTIGVQSMVKATYTWTGKSHTGGQQLKMTGVRYYVSKDPATLAVIRYEDASSEFDQQEADGFAGSFRWL